MAVLLSPVGGVAAQFFDNSGNPLSGGKLYSYSAGTTTPAATYTTSLGTTAHTNPIVLDAGGRVPGGEIWLTDGIIYKFVLQTSTGTLIATYDNIVGINSNFVNYTAAQEIQTATAGQTVFDLTTMQYQPGTNSLTVYVDGVNQYGPGSSYAYLETDSDTVTFVSGLHEGAEVKFTTTTQTTGNATDASVVSYTPLHPDPVTTTVQVALSQFDYLGSATTGVWYRAGVNYESAGTVEKEETRPFYHDFRPLVSDGSDFDTDGANMFMGFGAGNFTMSALPIADVPAGVDYNLQCSHNIGYGVQALSSLTIGYKNTGIGTNTFRYLTQGHGNTALGRDAGHELTEGNDNTSLGFTAAFGAETGDYNTSVGVSSFYNNTTGSGNVSIGRRAAFSYTVGSYNISIGEQAATGQTEGSYNTIIGKQTANNGILTANNNTVIGSRVTGLSDVDGQVVLADGNGNKYLYINPLGASYAKIFAKDTTAVNLSATDGQESSGASVVVKNDASSNNAFSQIAFQPRPGNPWSRIVAWGGTTPRLSVVVSDVEVTRYNQYGDFMQIVNSTAPTIPTNKMMGFQLVSDTELKILVKGSDGVTRSASLTLS